MHGATLVEVRYRPGSATDEYRCTASRAETRQQNARLRPRRRRRCVAQRRGRHRSALLHQRATTTTRWRLPSTVASWDGDRLTVWDKVQSISGAQEAYADALGVPGDQVRVISPFVGGAFGSAGTTWPHQLLAAFAARQMRRPVKLVLTRKQMYSGIGYRPTSRQRMAIGADRSGRISAIVHEAHTETSRYDAYEDNLMTGAEVRRTARRTCARRIALCRSTSTCRRTCAGPARRPVRSRWSRRWTTWLTGWAWTRSSCGCATNPIATSPTTCRSPPGG